MSSLRFIRKLGRKRHQAVGVGFGPGGLRLHANHIPEVDEEITLWVACPRNQMRTVCVQGTVSWAQHEPTLVHPEPSYRLALQRAMALERAELEHFVDALPYTAGSIETDAEGSYWCSLSLKGKSEPERSSGEVTKSKRARRRTPSHVDLDTPDAILVSWGEGEIVGHAIEVTPSTVTVAVGRTAPSHYEKVTLTPSYPSLADPHLLLHGAVTQVEETDRPDGRQLLIRLWQIEEVGHSDAFKRYCAARSRA